MAAASVALILIPQSLAYAQLAGLPPEHGLYAAAAAPLLAALAGSSPYLQTGPVAMTSLLTLGALAPLAAPGSEEFIGLAAMLALVVGIVRLLLGILRAGAFVYLLSEPAIAGFTFAGALLIVASQVPALTDVPTSSSNPGSAGLGALSAIHSWEPVAVFVGVATILIVFFGRRLARQFPAVPIVAAIGIGVGAHSAFPAAVVGSIPSGLPPLAPSLPWSALPSLLLPGLVIAIVGFAEAVVIARRYAADERQRWDANSELRGQGLANLGAGLVSGYPCGGSLSRSALNKASGATTRWSGGLTGALVLLALPFSHVLSTLPRSVLAGLVIAATLGLLDPRVIWRHWGLSRWQGMVAVATFLSTLGFAPRIERGVLVGVVLAVAVHLARELRLDLRAQVRDGTIHIYPEGVLYYGSAPAIQDRIVDLIGQYPAAERVVLHLSGIGRIDLSGMLVLRSLLTDATQIPITIQDVPAHSQRLVVRVLPAHVVTQPPRAD